MIAPKLKAVELLVLVRGGERYAMLLDDAHRWEAVKTLSRWACNPELNFTHQDAETMAAGLCVGRPVCLAIATKGGGKC